MRAASFSVLLCLVACSTPVANDRLTLNEPAHPEIHTADYDLIIPADQKALLILFPCFPCDAADTRAESRIADTAGTNYL